VAGQFIKLVVEFGIETGLSMDKTAFAVFFSVSILTISASISFQAARLFIKMLFQLLPAIFRNRVVAERAFVPLALVVGSAVIHQRFRTAFFTSSSILSDSLIFLDTRASFQ
jgi:hypothetical protein